MLLQRNQATGIETVPTTEVQEEFKIIPDWLLEKPTPWSLVCFLEEVLNRSVKGESTKELFKDHKLELRPAKQLINLYGIEGAAQKILEKARQCTGVGSFTLWSIVREKGKHEKTTTSRRYVSRLRPLSNN